MDGRPVGGPAGEAIGVDQFGTQLIAGEIEPRVVDENSELYI